jgi:hypothetical protein
MRFVLIPVLAALGAGSAALFGGPREPGPCEPGPCEQGPCEPACPTGETCTATVTCQPDGSCRIDCTDPSGEACWVVLERDENGTCRVVDSGGAGACSGQTACGSE